ncbi:MAG: hypothetical protein H6Q60_1157 [Oscillospiraceae bacterium]|nr:hypothetical protein [Oscillospiraceae bacterium]
MNPLLESFPTAVRVDGAVYEVNADFRVCLKIILAFEDTELTDYEKQEVMLRLLYPVVPGNLQEAASKAVRFLDGGESQQDGSIGDHRRLYSFSKDAKFIYSAVKQTHGIDLETVGFLHWWKFLYLFMDLREDCTFQRLIYYRQKLRRGKLTKEEREYCNSIAELLALPEDAGQYQHNEDIAGRFFAQLTN